MSHFDILRQHPVRLEDISFKRLYQGCTTTGDVVGAFAQRIMRVWVERCPRVEFDRRFPHEVDGYRFERNPQGIVVYDGTRNTVHEYDDAVYCAGRPAVIEVKAWALNGIEHKIERGIRIAEHLYGDAVETLVFAPFHGAKAESMRRFEGDPRVHCFSLPYTKEKLQQVVEAYEARRTPSFRNRQPSVSRRRRRDRF